MKFFKFLAIAFPIYVGLTFLASAILNLGTKLPEFIYVPLQFIAMSLILITFPFTPLLKALGMYIIAYWSLPTTGGIILSAVIWEVAFLLILFIFWKFKVRKASPAYKITAGN